VLGPGSLFTSLMAVLLIPGIADAWRTSKSKKVFVLNLIGQDGETLGMDGREHLAALARVARIEGPGKVICHEGLLKVPPGLQPVLVDEAEAAEFGWKMVAADVADPEPEWPAHDPLALGRVLSELT
jgi:uncharacterized cofD-like protein